VPNDPKPIYKRIVLKVSGEALAGKSKFGIDSNIIKYIADELIPILDLNVQVAMVAGGGNFFRGSTLFFESGLDRVTGDYMGMLGTIINALAIRDIFERNNIVTTVMSALPQKGITDLFDRRKAIGELEQGRLVVFAGGTGNPLMTTDSALSLRGIEINADLLLKATSVDGVYNADPAKHADAKRFSCLTYAEVLEKELAVMDLAAFAQCRDHNMVLRIFNLHKAGALLRIVLGENEGTLVKNERQSIGG
jgi:uridylate kinase